MAYRTIRVQRGEAGIARIVIDRPEVRNALNQEMVDECHDCLAALEFDNDLRALVLTSSGGKAFISGADIAELRDRRREDALRGINATLFARVEAFPRPTVASIVGYCLGGGLELALACDFRVAGRSSRFGQPEVGLGIMAAAGATRRLPALVGLAAARRLLLSGALIDADEAARIELVDVVVEDDQVEEATRALLAPILAQAPEAVRQTKRALLAWLHGEDEASLHALDNEIQADLFEHPEKAARMDAFLEKHKHKHEPRGGTS